MKKSLSLILIAVCMLSLAACGGSAAVEVPEAPVPVEEKADLLGRYEAKIDMEAVLTEDYWSEYTVVDISQAVDFSEQIDVSGYIDVEAMEKLIEATDFGMLMDMFDNPEEYATSEHPSSPIFPEGSELYAVLVAEYREDGSYARYFDMESVARLQEEVIACRIRMNEEACFSFYSKSFANMGHKIETVEDLERVSGMTLEQLQMQLSGEDYLEGLKGEFDEFFEAFQANTGVAEGKYKAENGTLWTTRSFDGEIDPEVYESYEINGDAVTITAACNVPEMEYVSYPIEFVKVA